MSSKEIWATCIDCEAELKQSDKKCPKCGSTNKSYRREASVTIGIEVVETRVKHKRKGCPPFVRKIISRLKTSGDLGLSEGVYEEIIIDKEEKTWHHVVGDVKTGSVIHDEHEPLSKHKNQSKH